MDMEASSSRSSQATGPRVSQRPSNSCAFCTKRKIKCNKSIPCDNCIRRGHPEACSRMPAIVRGQLVNAPSTTHRAPLTPDQIRLLREGQLQRENVSLRRRVNDLENRLRDLEVASGGTQDILLTGSHEVPPLHVASHAFAESRQANAFAKVLRARATLNDLPGEQHSTGETEPSRQDDPDVLEPFVHVMGVPQLDRAGSPDPRRGDNVGNETPLTPINGLPDLPSRKATDLANTDLLILVPMAAHSKLIARASLKYMSFLHCAVYTPHWLAEHDEWVTSLSEGKSSDKSDAWLSFYFSILSVGMYFAGDLLAPALDLSMEETASLSSFWFDVCLEALSRSKFLSTNPTIESLQTIVVLPMVAYNFGASAYCEMLLHIGLRLAQLLKLHILGPEPEDKSALPSGFIQREVGRRLWLLLRLGEGRPDFANPGGLRLPQGVTAEPFNSNDDDITDTSTVHRPFTEFTIVTHLICAGRRYRIFRQFAEAFGSATSLKDQYVIAMAADQALQSNFTSFPCLQDSDSDTFDEHFDLYGAHDHRPHSRYIWSLLMPAGTVLVYRSFLGRSYVDERFAEVRETCLAAAREILRQRSRPVPPMFLRSWPIASYTVLAGVVIATELVHGSPSATTRAQLVAEIQTAIDSLSACGMSSLVVQRGMPLLRRFIDTSSTHLERATAVEGVEQSLVAIPDPPALPAVQDLWPGVPLEQSGGEMWLGASEDVWSSALIALENDEASGWWTTLL